MREQEPPSARSGEAPPPRLREDRGTTKSKQARIKREATDAFVRNQESPAPDESVPSYHALAPNAQGQALASLLIFEKGCFDSTQSANMPQHPPVMPQMPCLPL